MKFENLDKVLDASSPKKEIVNGYHICEAVSLTKNQLQPVSIYSKIYSSKSKGFKSKNEYTKENIDRAIEISGRRSNFVFDRGYDDNKIIDYVDKSNNNFVIRMDDKRTFLFKVKKKNCHEEAIRRKGKIRMELWVDDNEAHEVYVSHTKVTLPYNKRDYELVIVWLTQISRGISSMLAFPHTVIKEWQNIEESNKTIRIEIIVSIGIW